MNTKEAETLQTAFRTGNCIIIKAEDADFTVLNLSRHADMNWLRDQIGGWVELIPLQNDVELIIDEEGRRKGKPQNILATLLAMQAIVGDVVLLRGKAKLE